MQTQLKKMITYLKSMAKVLLDLPKKVWKNYVLRQREDIKTKLQGYYLSVDELPLYNWIKCIDGKFEYLRIDKNGSDEHDEIAWEIVYDEYVQRYGLGKLYNKLLKIMKKKAILQCDYVLTKEKFKLTEIELVEAQLQQALNNNGNGISIEESLIHLSKWLGQWINSKSITVREYFDLQKEYERFNNISNGKKNK